MREQEQPKCIRNRYHDKNILTNHKCVELDGVMEKEGGGGGMQRERVNQQLKKSFHENLLTNSNTYYRQYRHFNIEYRNVFRNFNGNTSAEKQPSVETRTKFSFPLSKFNKSCS